MIVLLTYREMTIQYLLLNRNFISKNKLGIDFGRVQKELLEWLLRLMNNTIKDFFIIFNAQAEEKEDFLNHSVEMDYKKAAPWN